ncbi:MAG: glycosyltransferase family 87 protein [Solirubrobacteraceae bacterium]|jgi:hypothetical protein
MGSAVHAPRDFKRAAERLLLGVLPVLSVPVVLILAHPLHNFAVDFHSWYWPAGRRVLEGRSPYTLPPVRALNYPAPAALLFVPFALLPHVTADWLFSALVLAAVPASLWLLGVRDWRIYGIVMLWQPVIIGYETANVSLLLMLGLALCWRFRDRAPVVGSLLALLIGVKIFPVLVVLWLLGTRRLRAFAWAVAATIVLNLISWWVVGFDQVSRYLHVLGAVRGSDERRGYSLISLALHLGAGQTAAYAIGIAAAAVTIGAALSVRGESRDRVLMSACLAACLLASPLVESHYMALIILPLALAQPRISPIWALPIILIVTPADYPGGWEHVLALCIFAAVIAVSMLGREHHGAARKPSPRGPKRRRRSHDPRSSAPAPNYSASPARS